MDYKKYPNRFFRGFITAPLIYSVFLPVVFFDFILSLYHFVCFHMYGMKKIDRSKYIKIDRHKLNYLNWFDKFNCVYCGYVNGFLQYAVKIVGDTEKYWCGIKHAKYKDYCPPKHQEKFLEYGDEKSFRNLKK